MYVNVIIFFALSFLLFIDKIFLPKSATRAAHTLMFAYVILFLNLVFPSILEYLAGIFKLSRPIDLLLYGAFIIFIRELVITRYKYQVLNKAVTDLTRDLAIKNAQRND